MSDAPALEERWAIVRGSPVFYRAGDAAGEAVLHLHGFAISGRYMLPTAELLADEYRTLVPDLPAFGRSPRPGHQLTIPELADTAAAFLDEMDVDRAVVVGNSLGCAVLAALAQRHPDRVSRAVLVSPAGGMHSRPLLRAVGQLALDATREPPSMARVAVPDYLSFGVTETAKLFVAMTRYPSHEALLGMSMPVLGVLGCHDPLLPPARGIRATLTRMQHDVTIAVLRDAAHAINYSHPRELAALVRDWVQGRLAPGMQPWSGDDGLSPTTVLTRDTHPARDLSP